MSLTPAHHGVIFALITFAAFSTADAAVKWLSVDYPVIQLVFLEGAFAIVPVAAFALATGELRSLVPRYPHLAFLRGLILAGSTVCILWAISHIPLADAYALAFTAPLIVTVLSRPLLGEAVGWQQWAAVVTGFVGVLVVLRPGLEDIDWTHAAALAAAVQFALGAIIVRRVPADERRLAMPMAALLCLCAATAPFLTGGWQPIQIGDLPVLALAGVGAGVAQICLALAFRLAPAVRIAPIQYSQMLWGIAIGAVVFGDRPDPIMIVGSGLIIGAGIAVIRAPAPVRP